MTGNRKLLGFLAALVVLVALAVIQPPQMAVLVEGLSWLAMVFAGGNVGEHVAQAWRERRAKE